MKLSGPSLRISAKLIGLFLVATAIVSGSIGSYYYLQELNSKSQSQNSGSSHSGGSKSGTGNGSQAQANYLDVITLVNYGNGTSTWYNETKVRPGWNFYNLTLFVANGNVEALYYPYLHAHYIIGINGVRNDNDGIHCTFCWTIWSYCKNDRAWAISALGADWITLVDGATHAWYYQDTSATPWKPPIAGVPVVPLCS